MYFFLLFSSCFKAKFDKINAENRKINSLFTKVSQFLYYTTATICSDATFDFEDYTKMANYPQMSSRKDPFYSYFITEHMFWIFVKIGSLCRI